MVVLVLGRGAGAYAATLDRWFGVAIAFVVLHFFLFCNVLRLSRTLELIWATVFVGLATGCVSINLLSWPSVFGGSPLATLAVAVIEVRRPYYHGVGWQPVNPNLPTWRKAHVGERLKSWL